MQNVEFRRINTSHVNIYWKKKNVFELSIFCVYSNKFFGFGLFCKGEREQISECSQCPETGFQSLCRE